MVMACFMPEQLRERQRVGIERAKKEGKMRGGKKGRKWNR
jgi:DNA invertase Pin-like site-specific DNA recombinase